MDAVIMHLYHLFLIVLYNPILLLLEKNVFVSKVCWKLDKMGLEIGYSNGSFGSLSPNKTCEDLTIAKLYADNTNTVYLILKGDTFGETIWKCLILTQGNTTIRLRKILSTITNDTEYSWDNIKAVEKFNVGKQWCIQLTQ